MLEYTKLMYKVIHVLKLIENVKIIMEKLIVRIYMQEPIKDVFYLMVIMNLIIKYVTILQNKVNVGQIYQTLMNTQQIDILNDFWILQMIKIHLVRLLREHIQNIYKL